MKRILILLMILATFVLFPVLGHTAGTCDAVIVNLTREFAYIQYSWVGDSGDGSVPATDSPRIEAAYIVLVITNPGTTPTASYDITLTDADSVDVMGGELADRSNSATEQVVPKIDTVYGGRFFTGVLTLNITNQDAVSATGTVKVFYTK